MNSIFIRVDVYYDIGFSDLTTAEYFGATD